MRHSTSSATRVLTIVSLVVLCSLSFSAVNAQDLDTPFNKRNVHHRRAIHHLRASSDAPSLTPTPTPTPTPSSTQSPSVDTTSTSPTDTSVSSSTSSTPTSSSTDSSTSPVQSTSTSQPPDSTTPSTSSTSSQTSDTPTSTPSSSRTTSSPSSSTSPPTSATPAKSNSPIGGSTTPHPSNSLVSSSGYTLATISGSTVYASPTVGATSKGFFANKAAVGATFSIIGIIGGLAAIIGAIKLIKRYRRSRDDEDDFYEKYPGAPGSATNHSHFSRELGQGPLGASATDLSIDAAPPEAYPDRAVHYGQPDPSTVFRPVDYGIDYPPNAADANASPAADTADPGDDIAYEYYEYDPNRPRSTSAGSHPFADPANAPRTAPTPPVSYPRPVQGRAQEMVTVDSYYGPNTAGVGASGVGFAQ